VADKHDSTGNPSLDRRDFFKGAALGAAGLVVGGQAATAETVLVEPQPVVELPTLGHDLAYAPEAQAGAAPPVRAAAQGRPASDFMVDVLKKIGFEYAAINPGSTFQGLHESFLNHGGNTAPELLTCLHEEAAVAMAHGYAKAAGKPMLVMVHGTVGLLHSSMALFQAWADRVPVVVIVAHNRNPSGVINRPHSAQDMGLLVRSFVKYDDEATTLERFAESAMRAYRIAVTPPMGPVLLTVSAELQEAIVNEAQIRTLVLMRELLAEIPRVILFTRGDVVDARPELLDYVLEVREEGTTAGPPLRPALAGPGRVTFRLPVKPTPTRVG